MARPGRAVGRGSDRGSATAELAAALPALVLLLLFALGSINAVLARMRCVDAARDAALAASRGDDGVAAGGRLAPPGATVALSVDQGTVRASVSVVVRPLGGHLPGIAVSATAVALREPDFDLAVPGGTAGARSSRPMHGPVQVQALLPASPRPPVGSPTASVGMPTASVGMPAAPARTPASPARVPVGASPDRGPERPSCLARVGGAAWVGVR